MVRVASTLVGAWAVVSTAFRIATQFNTIVPPHDATEIRIVHSPQAVENLQRTTGNMVVIPGLPLSLATLTEHTNRVLRVWTTTDGNTIAVLDRRITDAEEQSWKSFGAFIAREHSFTIIAHHSAIDPVQHSVLQGVLQGASLHSHGSIRINNVSAKLTIAPASLTINAPLIARPLIHEPQDGTVLFSATLSAADLSPLSAYAVTENTPGLASFLALARTQGISAIISQEGDSVPKFALTVPLAQETSTQTSQDVLTAFAREIVELPTIETVTAFLDDGTRTKALRTREEATLVVRTEPPSRFITATTQDPSLSLTPTPTLLTVKNFTSTAETPIETSPCLPGARAYLTPRALRGLLPAPSTYQPSTLSAFAWSATHIASTARKTRVCFE